MIDSVKRVHDLGLVHNDIKPDNILLKSRERASIESSEIVLIDFGIARPYIDFEKRHVEQVNQGFKGNLFFSSQNALNCLTTSRRDDMISLAYLMAYFFNGSMKWALVLDTDKPLYKQIKKLKDEMTAEKLCDSATQLLPFVKEIMKYKFEEEPNY